MTDSTSTAVLDRDDDPSGDDKTVRAATAPQETSKSGMSFETLAVCAFIFGIFAIVAAVFAIGMSARAVEVASTGGGGGGSSAAASSGGGPESAEVSMKEFAFDPSEITVAENGKIILKNEGAMEHDFSVEGVTSDMVAPGGSGELELTGIAPGTYKFFCTVPGHEAAGMKGSITVG